MTYIIIAIVIVFIAFVIGGMITLHNHVDKSAKEIMARFATVNNKKTFDKNQNDNESI